MKILITSDWNTYAINGVVTSIKNLMYGLRARGHEVKLLCLSSDRETKVTDDGWEVASLPAGVVYPGARVRVGLLTNIYDKVIDWGPDIIHSQCEMSSFIMAHHIARECGIPIVHTYHTVYEDYTHYVAKGYLPGAKKAVAELSKLLSGHCQAMVAPTDKVKELLDGYECKCPLYVVPSGIALDKFRQKLSDEERAELRKKYGISDDEKIALYLGRIADEKNIDELIKYISESDLKLKLLVAGGGPKLDDLIKEAKKQDVNNKVIFAGMVDPDDVWKFYQLGDFFTSASTSETQGLTYIEALSSGLPLLCRKDPCLDDVISVSENGYMFENETEYKEGLQGILRIIEDANYNRAEIAAGADKFSREHFASSLETIYFDILENYNIDFNPRPEISDRFRELIGKLNADVVKGYIKLRRN